MQWEPPTEQRGTIVLKQVGKNTRVAGVIDIPLAITSIAVVRSGTHE